MGAMRSGCTVMDGGTGRLICFNKLMTVDGSYEERVYSDGQKNGEAKLVGAQGDIFTFTYKEWCLFSTYIFVII